MNFISRFIAKQKDPEGFKNEAFLEKINRVSFPYVADKAEYHFKHSGNCGDIIYALPAMQAIAKGRPIHLHLNIDQYASYGKSPHPLGNVMLNKKMVNMLQPLLLCQANFKTCDIWNGQDIDVDLDYIRKYPFLLNRGNIARWYFLVFGVFYELDKPWLQATPDESMCNAILVARSQRYHAPGIRYDFLQKYEQVYFIGVEAEFKEMQRAVPHIQYKPVSDFLEMAQLIAGSKLFIGNQSFPYSLAEAMKVNRLLEWYFQTPNVIVEGKNGFDFCLQPNFQKLVEERFS
ncbi:MAG: hypothetical protein ABIS69_10245 [Sediminibacterium sp.]